MPEAIALAPTQVELWEEQIWDELLDYIEDRRVIPIIGSDLLVVENEGKFVLLDRYVALQLADRLKPRESGPPEPTLDQVVCDFLREKGPHTLYWSIFDIMRRVSFAPPEPLRQLARIKHFNLFVTTTFDSLLEQALKAEGRTEVETIAYSPDRPNDLPGEKESLSTVVYHLLGKVSTSPEFVISAEDLLEFVHAIQGKRRPKQLFYELGKNHLLILGANFPDWLARFFLRTAKGRRLSDTRAVLEIVADGRSRSDQSLVLFLKNFSNHTKVFEKGAVEFVGELWQRWRKRHPDSEVESAAAFSPPANMQPGAVFISYASQDRPAVRKLCAAFKQAGIDIWFDQNNLDGGDAWWRKIKKGIETCACFVAVLSHTTRNRLEGVYRKEWSCALERAPGIRQDLKFIVPIVIDDSQDHETFQTYHIVSAPDGAAPQKLIDGIQETVRSYLASKQIR